MLLIKKRIDKHDKIHMLSEKMRYFKESFEGIGK